MRRLVLLCCAAVLVGCAKKEAEPAADTTAAAPAPMMLTAADVAGKWHAVVMTETSDSVIVEYDLTATAADTGGVMQLPNRPAMTPTRVMFSGDSLVIEMGPYESVLRKGLQVTTRSVSRLQGGMLVGSTTAHYATASGDSVVMLRTRATRVP